MRSGISGVFDLLPALPGAGLCTEGLGAQWAQHPGVGAPPWGRLQRLILCSPNSGT